MKTQKTKSWSLTTHAALLALGATAALTLGACADDSNTSEGPPTQSQSFALQPAASCQQIEDRIVDATTEQILEQRYSGYGIGVPEAVDADDRGNAGNNNSGGSDSPDDYTTTNNQVEGVDEADFLKTDGDHIYVLSGRDLVILDSWPAEQASEIGRFPFADDTSQSDQEVAPRAMFLHGDKIAVFSSLWQGYRRRDGSDSSQNFQGTRISIIDISDRTAPVLHRQMDIEGNYVNGRMIDGNIYIVSNSGLQLPFDVWDIAYDDSNGLPTSDYSDSEAKRERLKNRARPQVRQMVRSKLTGTNIVDILPEKRVFDSSGNQIQRDALYSCTDIYMPAQIAQTGVLNITHFDLGNKSQLTSTGLLANGWELYASKQSLYISMSSNWWWWGWGDRDNSTHLHKFDLADANGPTRPSYAASGKVDGWLLNQFSMSEHNGFMRVVTTDNDWTWDEQTGESGVSGGNHLTILEEKNGELVETGSVRDLAAGERVYSARFMGDKGYVVTFRQTDPLFTFDLSDPYNPKLMGELKINGFSSYMHPMDGNHLLTIGQDATSDGRVTGVHLQIFDVTDMTNPVRDHQFKISTGSWSSWSEAMWDHHAFTFHNGVLAVPMNIHEWDKANGQNFSGLILYDVDAQTGITERGRINHADMVADWWCKVYPNESWACGPNAEAEWWTSIRRSIFIEDYVFSFSDIGFKVNDLAAPNAEHVSTILNEDDQRRYYY